MVDKFPDLSEQPMQLRIGFVSPTRPQTLHLTLMGLTVLVEPDDGNYDLAREYLTAAGVTAGIEAGKGLYFLVKHLTCIKNLPSQVEVVGDNLLRPLIMLILNPSADNLPATLTLDFEGELTLSWFDGNLNHDEPFSPNASAALLNTEVPFVATTETWDALKSYCRLPVMAGRARLNLDGYVEIATTKPQLVETSPLPALFRIDDTHFGLPLSYASALDADHSFVWEGHRPTFESAPMSLPSTPLIMSGHSEADLKDIVSSLAAQRATVLSWDSGLGRRVFALAAVEALDAFPLLIIAHPGSVWAWQRHLDLFGKTNSLTHDRADVHIITYRDLVNRPLLTSPAAIIFDSLSRALDGPDEVKAALHRLDGVLDAYRIACDSDFPTDINDAVESMSVLRPGEFRSDISVVQRYPVHTEKRAREHVQAYLSERVNDGSFSVSKDFKHSSVISVEPTDAQIEAFELAVNRPRDPSDVLTELLGIASSGPATATSPKVVTAASRVRKAVADKRSVVLLTRHSRTAHLLKGMLRPLDVRLSEGTNEVAPAGHATIIKFDTQLPSLRSFQDVIVVDYPWSTEVLEKAVGSAADSGTPNSVTCIHLENSVDDRLAMLAARRRERSIVANGSEGPSAEELTYLLAPRN